MESTKVRHLRPFLMLQLLFSSGQKYQNVCCIYGLKTAYEAFVITLPLEDDNILCGQILGPFLDLSILL